MANYLVVRHKVADFAAWKKVYDSHRPKQKEAGLTERHVLRGADASNETIVIFEAADLAKARAFAASADLRETMMRAGVQDKPDVYFMTSV
jgi:hypothetical protein